MPRSRSNTTSTATTPSQRARGPSTGFVPILLHREQGTWRVDLRRDLEEPLLRHRRQVFPAQLQYALRLRPRAVRRRADVMTSASCPWADARLQEFARTSRRTRPTCCRSLQRAEVHFRNAVRLCPGARRLREGHRSGTGGSVVLQTFAERALYLGISRTRDSGIAETAGPGFELIARGGLQRHRRAKGGHALGHARTRGRPLQPPCAQLAASTCRRSTARPAEQQFAARRSGARHARIRAAS